jgi:hypothetical protein
MIGFAATLTMLAQAPMFVPIPHVEKEMNYPPVRLMCEIETIDGSQLKFELLRKGTTLKVRGPATIGGSFEYVVQRDESGVFKPYEIEGWHFNISGALRYGGAPGLPKVFGDQFDMRIDDPAGTSLTPNAPWRAAIIVEKPGYPSSLKTAVGFCDLNPVIDPNLQVSKK